MATGEQTSTHRF